jgi:hypothetical protein
MAAMGVVVLAITAAFAHRRRVYRRRGLATEFV